MKDCAMYKNALIPIATLASAAILSLVLAPVATAQDKPLATPSGQAMPNDAPYRPARCDCVATGEAWWPTRPVGSGGSCRTGRPQCRRSDFNPVSAQAGHRYRGRTHRRAWRRLPHSRDRERGLCGRPLAGRSRDRRIRVAISHRAWPARPERILSHDDGQHVARHEGGQAIGGNPEALEDAQSAVRLVRANARKWAVDPARVGFVGFRPAP